MRSIDIPQLPYLTSLPSIQTLPSFVPLMNFISLPWPLSRFSAAARAVDPTVSPSTSLAKPSSIVSLLRYYETPGVPPPSSRVDPLLQQKGGHVMGIRDLLSLGGLIALKGESTSGSPQQCFFLSACHNCVHESSGVSCLWHATQVRCLMGASAAGFSFPPSSLYLRTHI